MKLIYEETISRNKEYVKNEEDIVNYKDITTANIDIEWTNLMRNPNNRE